MIQSYFNNLKTIIDLYAITSFVLETNVNFETRTSGQGYLKGIITFVDGSRLHFSEYLDTSIGVVDKLMYTYHYQDTKNQLIFRYDNAAHKPALPSREHKHIPKGMIIAVAPTLEEVLSEITVIKKWL